MREDAFSESLGISLEEVAPVGIFKRRVLEFWIQNFQRPHNVLTGSLLLSPDFAEHFVFF